MLTSRNRPTVNCTRHTALINCRAKENTKFHREVMMCFVETVCKLHADIVCFQALAWPGHQTAVCVCVCTIFIFTNRDSCAHHWLTDTNGLCNITHHVWYLPEMLFFLLSLRRRRLFSSCVLCRRLLSSIAGTEKIAPLAENLPNGVSRQCTVLSAHAVCRMWYARIANETKSVICALYICAPNDICWFCVKMFDSIPWNIQICKPKCKYTHKYSDLE